MRFRVAATLADRVQADLVVVPVFPRQETADLGPLWAAAGGDRRREVAALVKGAAFVAKAESLLALPLPGTRAGWFL
ncbi:MAG: hypothetical protein IH621_03750, partial [Krumholzibacteria bacterium]|nr:hypothetical protein [Candidatus Krumholzibacteria bacterium]